MLHKHGRFLSIKPCLREWIQPHNHISNKIGQMKLRIKYEMKCYHNFRCIYFKRISWKVYTWSFSELKTNQKTHTPTKSKVLINQLHRKIQYHIFFRKEGGVTEETEIKISSSENCFYQLYKKCLNKVVYTSWTARYLERHVWSLYRDLDAGLITPITITITTLLAIKVE